MAKAVHPWPTTFSDAVIADLRQARGPDAGEQDRPLVAQLGGAGISELVSAARLVEPFCDAVDLNLGCPQRTAAENGFGAFLMDDSA
jgi:tRNA-dihydrouridine synthase